MLGTKCEWYYNQTNATRLPNITALFEFEHRHGLRTYLNDHPKNMAPETSPDEIEFRYSGLVSMLKKGCDFWWYDPNWCVSRAHTRNIVFPNLSLLSKTLRGSLIGWV